MEEVHPSESSLILLTTARVSVSLDRLCIVPLKEPIESDEASISVLIYSNWKDGSSTISVAGKIETDRNREI